MKKLVSIFILSSYLMSSTELHEFLKMPALVSHYFDHKVENQDLSLMGFLLAHYTDDASGETDNGRDMDLPFKSHDGCTNLSCTAYPVNAYTPVMIKSVDFPQETFPLIQDEFFNSLYLSSIWQPPKSC